MNTTLIIIALTIASLAGTYFVGHHNAYTERQAYYKQILDAQDVAAKNALEHISHLEEQLKTAKEQQDVKDNDAKNTITNLNKQLASIRLRLPTHNTSSSDTASSTTSNTGNSTTNSSEASGVLPADFTGLLQKLTLEADNINIAYESCRNTLLTINSALSNK